MSVELFFTHGIDLPNRVIYIGSVENTHEDDAGTDYQMAERVLKGLVLLDRTEGDISLIMNNPGGNVYDGIAIYDAIKACRNRVICKVYGKAWSMGGIILQAADVRLMAPNSVFMLHDGTDCHPENHPRNIQAWVEEGKRVDMWVAEMFSQNTGLSLEAIGEMLRFDTILPANEAVELGFADGVTKSLSNNEKHKKRK